MIFLSHNFHDKDVVGPIAIHLGNRYGKDNVFYDVWTVKPGDSIIEKMSEGLSKCKYFFFFISENSLKSKMVSLEWQSALYKSAKEGIKFIPVKIDDSDQPTIMIDKLYLNMYEDGIDITIIKITDIIENRDSSIYNATFHNIFSSIQKKSASEYTVTVYAKKFIERDAKIAFSYENDNSEINIEITSDGTSTVYSSSGKIDGRNCQILFLSTRPITPKKPIEYSVKNKKGQSIKSLRIWHVDEDDKKVYSI